VKLATRDNQILHAGYGVISEDNVVLQSNENAIRFLFNSFNHSERSKFRYRLIGLEEEWSDWTNELSKEYNNLSHGSYSFDVQTADMYGTTSVSKSYSFEIKAPWYLSSVAKLLVIILFVGGLLLIYIVPQKKYKTETKVLQLANQQSEEEIEILKSQQLESEIVHKNAQLASSTLHLVQKNETINKIRTEIESVRKTVKDPEAKKELKKVISVLSDDERLEDDWESFSVHFDQVHSDFLKRLKEQYPELTRKDRKMAAYLRMNLSTKEIAPLLGISARGVEIGRYRLRKKMELDTGIKLRKYMVEF
jgi:DNA-binding CsgD family transcriptional regulator